MELELNASSPMSGDLTRPNHDRDPEEKEISDDDDDDRNHKHRRRETGSQSLGRDSLEQSLSQTYRKRNRPFENGQSDPFPNFDKRRSTGVNFSRFSGDHGPGRGRGRDYMRDSRFGSVDVASQMAHPGCIPSAMFPGRGLSNVSNGPSGSWNGFGLIPGVPNGAMDVINPLGLPGMLRPQFNHSLNMGIQRQRCRDFEERGFCMRGDMCPMEHGVNRIVVEDVQSLSQFNLSVAMPNAHLLATGFVPSVSVSSSTLMNNRVVHDRTSKSTLDDDAPSLDGVFSGAINASGADVYDPDQPLWNNDAKDMSTPLFGLQPSNIDGSESLVDADLSDRLVRSCGTAVGSQSTSSSVWGRITNSKNKMELREKSESKANPSGYPESKAKDTPEASTGTQGTLHPGNQHNVGPKIVVSVSKMQNDIGSNVRKQNQKAQRTLFINCIPLKDNKKETLLNHFRKFGEVIDVYIPANSERAFVQFSKREEAERALKAPDAVMGSRFIKLWWANRDSVADEGMSSGNNVLLTASVASGSPHPSVISKGKNYPQYAASKGAVSKTGGGLVTITNDSKLISANSPKASPPVQKKMENLDVLKEELRKKQEMLEQKRTEFRRQLDKLANQATSVKSIQAGQATKRQKVEMSSDTVQAGNSADAIVSGSPRQAEMLSSKVSNVEGSPSLRSKSNSRIALQDSLSLKHTVHSMTTYGAPFHMNRYKLDNRPTAFRIHGPLPASLANVTALKDHFSSYGEISNVEIEDLDEDNCPKPSDDPEATRNCNARISFASRASAERAFLNAKSWQEHNFNFVWLTSSIIPTTSRSSGESSSALKLALNAEVHSIEETTDENSCDAFDPTKLGPSPPIDVEDDLVFEANSPENSANFIPLENSANSPEAVEPEI